MLTTESVYLGWPPVKALPPKRLVTNVITGLRPKGTRTKLT